MNYKTFFLVIIVLVILGGIVSSKSLKFKETYCVVGSDCTLNDLFLTGNFSFVGDIVNVTIINQNVTGQMSIGGSLNVNGNVTADYFFGNAAGLFNLGHFGRENFTELLDDFLPHFWNLENSTAQGYIKSTLWNSSDKEVFLNDSTKSLRIENITSPHTNKSYITFFSDGSVGITLDPVPDNPVQEELQLQQSIETIEYTK